jgi:gliding motility-associated-like protein
MNVKRSLVLVIFSLLCWKGFAQNLSNKGKEFWVGYGHHQFMERASNGVAPNNQEMVLYFSSEQAATVTVTINGTAYSRTYNVPANGVIASEFLPKAGTFDCRLYSDPPSSGGTGGEGVFSRGIRIVSNVPIVAYAHIFGNASSGATMLMPVETWGYAYASINSQQRYADNCFSWMYVVAKENNTRLEITPTVPTRNGRPANVPFTVDLQKGEIYQVVGASLGGGQGHELTGTRVKSVANASGQCYPIGVFSGSSRTYITCSGTGGNGGDNIMQQIFPYQAWGKRYLTAPTSNASSASAMATNIYRVAVKDPNTVVKRNGVTLTGIQRNFYYEFQSNTADYIEADKPIMVAQYMASNGGCPGTSGDGDPEMIYLSPLEQGIKKIGFFRNNEENIGKNYLTLIIPTAGVASLRIDGSSAFSHTYPHPNLAGYTVVVKRWEIPINGPPPGQCLVQSDSAFTAVTYGLGSVESYGYNAGTLINNLSAVGNIHNTLDPTVSSHTYTCTNTPVELSVLVAYQPTKIVWKLSSIPQMSPNADVTDNAPAPVGTAVFNGVTYYKYTLPGTYTFSQTGVYFIPLVTGHPSVENCNNSEEVGFFVEVKGKPKAEFTYTHTGCAADTVYFTGQTPTSNGFNISQWNWEFPGPEAASGKNVKKKFDPGAQSIKLTVISSEGCVGDTVRTLDIFNKPVADFTMNPAALCEGGSVTFTDNSSNSGGGPVGSWYWDFGNGNTLTTTTNNPQTVTYPAYGSYTVKHVVKVSNLCVSDTMSRVITVNARPRASFTYPVGCLPVDGIVQFTNATTIPDGQAISYSWNFGDPNATASNPNTSTLENPTHFYTTGNYPVRLTATSANGCVKDTLVNASFNMKPLLSYPALQPVCENTQGAISVAQASVTNAVPGTGIYKGPSVTDAGQFTPSTAGPGSHTIWYVFTSSAGCKDSVSQTISVSAKPVVDFTYPTGGCLPQSGLAQFTGTATIADAQTLSYSWNFGDPNATAANPNTSTDQNPTHNFSNNGTYNITLTVTSSNGCTGSMSKTVTFNVKPALAYPALPALCENVAAVSVATASVTNGVSGTGIYKGPGTSSAGSFDPAAAGSGTHTIWYVFTSAGGCVDSVSQTISVSAKPLVDFTYPTGGCLPQSGLAQFTNATTIADAQTLTYSWNFGDPNATAANPNTSTDPNPTHNFSNYGTYNISLSVTSSNGCMSSVSKTVTFSVKPALTYPALPAICESAAAASIATASVTNGVTGTGIYKGPGTSSAGSFDPAAAGNGQHTIWYVFTSAGGCIDSVSQTIRVHPKPAPSFTFTQGCLDVAGLMQFTNASTIAGGGNLTYSWSFGDANATTGNPNTSTVQNPTHSYSLEGTYNVTLSAASANGCVAEKTVPITVSKLPQLTYPALAPVCENAAPLSVATASVTNGVTGSGIYEGNGVSAAGQFNPKLAGNGNHTIRYIFTTTGGCKDTVEQTILVHPRPRPNFTYPAGCLPVNGQVQFTNMSAIVSNSPLTYSWNFGDPNATATNPNTSTVRHPVHSYSADGDYSVMLAATSVNGCTVDTTITVAVRKTPELSYPALTAICENGAPVSVALATVTNGVSGTGVYSGAGVTAAGMFNPATAGSGLHTITYTFTSARGCAGTITSTIRVHPKPQASFTVNTDICVNGTATISDASTIASGSITAWNWSFGDNTTASYTNGNPFTKNYTAYNNYTITLSATSDNGCVSDIASRILKVHPLPVPNFTMPASVCMPNGSVAFTNTTTIAEPSTLGYQWSFGDGNTSTANSPAHVYASSGSYPVRLTVTSEYGCVQQVEKTFSSFYDKPIASFSVNADTLCEGTDNVFTDQSMAPNSTITAWEWKFDDGSTSTQKNPTKRYALPGRYDVELTVMNAVGCRSDVYTEEVIVYLQPVIDAGPSFVVPQGTVITFKPTANDSVDLRLQWSPAADFSNPGRLTQTLVAMRDQTYTLTATGDGDCSATDFMTVKILKPVNVPNAFSPNGDGIHDRWEIPNLLDYPGVTVEVFNRYGQKVFSSNGYSRPWDGTMNGKPLPLATYYYVINLKNGFPPVTGSITIIR